MFGLILLLLATGLGDPPTVGDRVQQLAQADLDARLGEAAAVEVRVQRWSLDGAGSLGDDALRIAWPAGDALPRGRVQVKLERRDDAGQWTSGGWARLEVAHFDSVLVPVERLRKDDDVPPALLTPAWLDVTDLRTAPLTPAQYRRLLDAGGAFATRGLRDGHPLLAGDLRPPYAAEAGTPVVLHYTRGAIRLKLSCTARSAGFVDDVIRLYAPATQAMYRARLTQPGVAEWIETL